VNARSVMLGLFLYGAVSVTAFAVGMGPVVDDSLQVWFRADKGCLDANGNVCWGTGGIPVKTWTDQAAAPGQSGANNAAQTGADNRPQLYRNVTNTWPVVRFDESHATYKQYLVTGSISGFANRSVFTAFVVASPTGEAGDVDLFFANVHANHEHLWGAAAALGTPTMNSFFARGNWGGSPSYKGALGAAASGFNVTEGVWTADGMVRVFVNGVAGTTASEADWQPDAHTLMIIGKNYTSDGNALSGDLAEILIYSRELSEAERHQVGEYLEAKYNLTTAYATAKPTGIRFSHSGNADPATMGWLYGHRSSAWDDDPNCSDGPVTNDMGCDAWSIADGSTGGDTLHAAFGALTVEERAAATNGWILRVRARVVEPQNLTSSSQSVIFQSVHPAMNKAFAMYLGADGDNKAQVGLFSQVISGNPLELGFSDTYDVGSAGYHLYELRYKPSLGKAELYVDGMDTGIDYEGYDVASPVNRIAWGSTGSPGTGKVNYNLVEFEILSGKPAGTVFLVR
jgi:hypothetical protein